MIACVDKVWMSRAAKPPQDAKSSEQDGARVARIEGGAYAIWLAEKLDKIRALPATPKISAVAKQLPEVWKVLPEDQKRHYLALAENLRTPMPYPQSLRFPPWLSLPNIGKWNAPNIYIK